MSISPISVVPSNSLFQPPTNLQKAGSSQQTEFQRLTQALQSGLASAGQVPNSQDIFSAQQGSAAASVSRPAHHHRPLHHGAESLLTSGFSGQTSNAGAGTAGAEKVLSALSLLA